MHTGYGEIEALHSEAEILWKIPGYFSNQNTNSFYNSPHFHFLGSAWSLVIYPNVQRSNRSVGSIGLYVSREALYEEHDVSFWVGIVCHDNELLLGKRHCIFSKNGMQAGWAQFMERRILEQNRYRVCDENTLTIKFVAKPLYKAKVHKASQPILDGRNALSQDFQTLLSSEETSDVTITVESRVFRAHKLILTARSTVFAAMFKHNMKEKNTGSVDIVDCDPLAFQEFLSFMYTGKIDNLSWGNVCEVFCLANKYDLRDLRQICIDYMEQNLCLNVVCDAFAVADKFNAAGLRKSSKEFLLKNLKSVMSTANWIRFISENPILATEVLMISVN